jgi:GGDEF domain-containing protein
VIVLTADVSARDRTEPMATGIDGFVSKPFGADELAQLVASRLAAARDLAERGAVDPATGALSAAALDARIATELEMAATVGEPLTFALVALRSGRSLRERLGDDGVGWVVRRLVEELRPALPDGAVIGRTDGDELAVLVPGMAAGAAARAVEVALGEVRKARALPGGGETQPDPVAGIAGWPEHAVDAEGLFMAADAALAEAMAGAPSGVVAIAR